MKTEWLFDNFPFISTDRITLCKIQPTDKGSIIELSGDLKSNPYIPSSPDFDKYNINEFFSSVDAGFSGKKFIKLGIYKNSDINELLGTVDIGEINHLTGGVEISFALLNNYRGQGIASDAVSAIVKFLFERVEVNRIQATAMLENKPYERVLLRCGFIKEGVLRQGEYWDGKGIVSLSTYSILKNEYDLVRGSTLVARDMDISIVRMSGADYEVMAKWLTDENVLKYYDGRDNPSSLGKVIADYQPMVSGDSTTVPCIIRENGRDIGYIQFYPITDELQQLKVTDYKNPYGLDLFIGEADARGRGIGPRVIRLICAYLFGQKRADVIISDPQAWNERSVSTFTKCGFKQAAVLLEHELHEGKMQTNIIMHRTKD